MRPRIFPDSQQQLASVCEALSRRLSARPEPAQLPTDRGPLIALVLLTFAFVGTVGFGWNYMMAHAVPTSHLYDETMIAKTRAWQNWLEAKHLAWMPDGRLLPYGRDRGTLWKTADLPKTGNQIGDVYGIVGSNAHYVWEVPLGDTQPRWIDP